jgi:hypothetical protein
MWCVAPSHWVGRAQAKTCYGEQSGEQNDALEVIYGAAPLRFGISGNNARTIEPAPADDNDFAESEGFDPPSPRRVQQVPVGAESVRLQMVALPQTRSRATTWL